MRLHEKKILHRLFHSLFFKIPSFFLIFFIFLASASILFTRHFINRQIEENLRQQALLIISSLNWAITPLLNIDDFDSIQKILQNAGQYRFINKIRLYSPLYKVIASTEANDRNQTVLETPVSSIIQHKTEAAQHKNLETNVYQMAITMRGLLYKVLGESHLKAILFLEINLDHDEELFSTFSNTLFYQNILLMLILILLIISLLLKMVFRPLQKFMQATREISGGNYEHQVALKAQDEFGEFAHMFNQMLSDINTKNSALELYSQNLEMMVNQKTHFLQEANAQLKNAYNQLQHTQTKLLHADKMASIGQLAAGMAHEINNPLGFIKSNLGTLQKYMENIDLYCSKLEENQENLELKKQFKIDYIRKDITSLLSESLEGAGRVETLVKSLKDFAHLDQGQIAKKDINQMLENTLLVINNSLKHKITVIKNLDTLPLVSCNPQQINQVFLNLLMNAVQAIGEKGTIEITTTVMENSVIIEIKDDGPGIPGPNLEKIFEPFFTTKDVGSGTGLGLSVVYDIIQAHQGSIEVKSEPQDGATFKVTLPIEALGNPETDT